MKAKWKHNCDKCTWLGQTIGGGKLVDLYQCNSSLVARYGNGPGQYYSCDQEQARPEGHAELWVAKHWATGNLPIKE